MSVIKMLSRVVAPSEVDLSGRDLNTDAHKMLHDHTYGITSDPLTQLACAVTALIHDVDHVGVPNAQLIKENDPLVEHYGARSVAEQNSLEMAWGLFLAPKYKNLRTTICTNERELAHFRQLLVNGVMATDIVDKELKNLRNQRWDTAFAAPPEQAPTSTATVVDENDRSSINRKATIVIEHLIQASDVSHTMQHWHVYRKWVSSLHASIGRGSRFKTFDCEPILPRVFSHFASILLCTRMNLSLENVMQHTRLDVLRIIQQIIGTRVKLDSLIFISFH